MKKALTLTAAAFTALVLLFALTSWSLAALRTRLVDSFTLGDVLVVVVVFLYGLFLYKAGVYIIRGSCKSGYRNY